MQILINHRERVPDTGKNGNRTSTIKLSTALAAYKAIAIPMVSPLSLKKFLATRKGAFAIIEMA